MKKEIIIVFIIVVLIIVGHILTQNYTKKFFEEVSTNLETIRKNIESEMVDISSLNEQIENIQEHWDDKFNILAIYIEHDELEKVETQLITIKANISVKEYNKCIEELEKCRFILQHIEDKESLKLINVF